MSVPVLLLTGPVGVGKTTVTMLISDLLEARRVSHALIDMDWMRWAYPRPVDDRFHLQLGLRNLAALWQGYGAAGVDRLLLVDVVEDGAQRQAYARAIPGAEITIVRLHASVTTLQARVAKRESGDSLIWHQQRAFELALQMERDALEDLRIETEDHSAHEIAVEILDRVAW
ncbi:hypothetical protein GC175_25960 [bacterium]|nr:hypothetical protein [bacterium]